LVSAWTFTYHKFSRIANRVTDNINVEKMLRFSDRLTSTSSTLLEQVKTVAPASVSSDDTTKSTTPTEQEYITLVELIGLHQTVKVLEAEYSLVAGGDGKLKSDVDIG
jgi:hypothetical protein